MTKLTRVNGPLTLALALTAAVALASCSTTSPASTTPSSSTSTTPSTSTSTTPAVSPSTSAGRRIDILVTGKQVTPKPALVNIAVGESLTITVTSDHNDELHAHGFEIEKDIKAGQTLEITVRGAKPGVYEVELHHPELRILQVAVR